MKYLILFVLIALFAAPSEAACGRAGRVLKGAGAKGKAVLRFVLPPYGR